VAKKARLKQHKRYIKTPEYRTICADNATGIDRVYAKPIINNLEVNEVVQS